MSPTKKILIAVVLIVFAGFLYRVYKKPKPLTTEYATLIWNSDTCTAIGECPMFQGDTDLEIEWLTIQNEDFDTLHSEIPTSFKNNDLP